MTSEERAASIGGISAAFIALLRILIEKDVIQINDWDIIIDTLEKLNDDKRIQIPQEQKEAISGYSNVLKRLRPGI
jgi:hypothetical protein